MGGLFHLFHFHHGHKGRKHKKKGRASLKLPRNSSELRAETSRSPRSAAQSAQETKRSYGCNVASLEKSITEEISNRSNDRQNAPGIVARLMGMDMFPTDANPETTPVEDNSERIKVTDKLVEPVERASAVHATKKSKSSSKKEHRLPKNAYYRYWNSVSNLGKPVQPPVHPHEKELQNFKKEFEAWQTARFLECARVVELGNIPGQWLAQLDLTKEKMARYETSRKAFSEKSKGGKTNLLKSRSVHGGDFQKQEMLPVEHKESHSFSGRSIDTDFEQLSLKDSDLKSDKSTVPARIVILRPGSDSFTTNDESWVSSCSMEDRDHIEDLLEEVKQRLKYEMPEETFRKVSTVRGGGIEIPFQENPAYIKRAHQPPAKEVKEYPAMDLERKLGRSESIISCQSDEQAFSSPKFMSRDTRKFLSERLEIFLSAEDHQNNPDISNDALRVPPFDDIWERLEKARDILNAESGRNNQQAVNREADAHERSPKLQFDDDIISQEQPSPRNLVRSLSGSSLGKLHLEDRFISTGTQIMRKQETLECLSPDFKSQMRERSDFRDKGSLSLRKKLFNKKLQSLELSQSNELNLKDISSGPTILKSFNENNENSAEVPPSPASICSSTHEEFWKPTDYLSPITNPGITSVGDQSMGNVFREISSNLTELRRQLNQLEYEGSEITTLPKDDLSETEGVGIEQEVIDLEYEAEAYIRDLLITSGLYHGSWDKSYSRWDPYVKPLTNWVFEKVEEAYKTPINDTDEEATSYDDTSLERKLLFDLLNEALSVILGPPRTLPKFRRKVTDIDIVPLPQRRNLLEQVLEMIREYIYPSMETASYNSLDDLVAYDLNATPWFNLIDKEIRDLGKELEYQIAEELIDEVVMDILLP